MLVRVGFWMVAGSLAAGFVLLCTGAAFLLSPAATRWSVVVVPAVFVAGAVLSLTTAAIAATSALDCPACGAAAW